MLNSTIAMEYLFFYKFFLFISGIAAQIFLGGLFSKWSLACILCFTATLFLPYENYMTNYLEMKEEDIVTKTYESVFYTFEDDYLRSNPITRPKGMEKFLEAKFKAGDLTEEEFHRLRKDIQNNANNEEMFKLNYSSKNNHKKALANKYKKNLMKGKVTVNENQNLANAQAFRPNNQGSNMGNNNLNLNNPYQDQGQFNAFNNNNAQNNQQAEGQFGNYQY